MTSYFDKLGLSPQERRLVVIVAIVVFVVINWWVIIPMFGDWGRYQQRINDATKLKEKYNAEIGRRNEYETKLNVLKQQGSQVASEEAALRLQQEVISQANLTGLGYGTISPVNRSGSVAKTNAFFDEAAVSVSINTGEKELIDFLVRLADREMLIRAKSMDIGPDPTQVRLQGNLTLVKSFQRKVPVRTAVTPAATPGPTPSAPAARPATTTTATTPPAARPTAATGTTSAPPAVAPTPGGPRRDPRPPGIVNSNTAPARVLPKQLK